VLALLVVAAWALAVVVAVVVAVENNPLSKQPRTKILVAGRGALGVLRVVRCGHPICVQSVQQKSKWKRRLRLGRLGIGRKPLSVERKLDVRILRPHQPLTRLLLVAGALR